jgi:hypothetical protein
VLEQVAAALGTGLGLFAISTLTICAGGSIIKPLDNAV